jgi:fibronectin-binding autotransporter adhesin
VNANWTNASVYPNGAGSNAVINADIAVGQTINLNVPIALGALSIGDPSGAGSYTINANGGSLTLDNGANAAAITQLAASKGDTIAAPIAAASNLAITNYSANVLTLAGNVSGNGLFLSGGTLQLGDGTVNGAIAFNSITNQGAMVFRRSDNVTVAAAISGSGSLTQNGAGTLTLSGGSSFLGPVTVAQGTLKIGSSGALGATNGNTTVQSGATLDVNGISLGGEPVIVSGSGVNNEGAIYNSAGQITSGLQFVTLAGDTWFGGAGLFNPSNNQGRWDVRGTNNNIVSGTLSTSGQSYNLIKTGSNQVSIVGINVDPKLANIDIQQGVMGWETVTTSMGNPASNLTVRAGATLSFFNAATAWNKHFILYGNGVTSTVTNWSGANTMIGPVQLNGDCVFWGGGTSLTLGNVVSGTGNLIKNGSYSLILSNANNYTGNTAINAGTLALRGNGSIAGSVSVTISAGAILDASARSDSQFTVASGQTLQGNGSVTGGLLISPGALLAPGTLTVSGAATLRGTTFLELNKTAHTNDLVNAASISYGGTLVLTNLNGTLAAGDSFTLFNAGSYGGQFTNIVPAIPGLNLAWNLSNGVMSVVSTPTPSPVVGINMDASGVVFSGSNGVPRWPYYLLTSTNASLPMSNWTLVMSNWFDGSGNFILTNDPALNGPQRFFILQLP